MWDKEFNAIKIRYKFHEIMKSVALDSILL